MGFVVFASGGVGYAYMDFAVHGSKMFTDFKRDLPMGAYRQLVKDNRAPAWPLYLAVCIPLGIAVCFGSILFSDHLR